MRLVPLFLWILLLLACVNNNEIKIPQPLINNPQSGNKSNKVSTVAQIEFIKKHHDFSEIYQGEKLEYKFRFKNTGNANLIITSTKTTCGCTVSDYPKEPILPGESAYIKVVFDSENKSGFFHKAIEVMANTIPNNHVLEITGKILTT